MSKIKIIVRLPDNRDYAGRLHVENAAGKRLAGPFPICGRANDQMARDGKNPGRERVLPFGDTPLGGYQVQKIIGSGDRTAYSSEDFGSSGIILLQPASGEAALAEANGRFGFFIQGGAMSRNGCLRPADGSLRLSNRDQRKLVSILRSCEPIDCECEVSAGMAKKGRRVADVPAASVLAQARALLTGLLGTTNLEPAHRALLKKMLLAGRITVSIPSILMMSTPGLAQQTSMDKETHILLASRDTTFSFPIMLAQADPGSSSQDYVGQLPSDTQANQQANTVGEHSQNAANSQNLEDAKTESGVGFDTAGGQGTGGGSEPPPVNVVPEPGGDSQNQPETPANSGGSGLVGGNPNPPDENVTPEPINKAPSSDSGFGTAATAATVGAVAGALIQHAISPPANPTVYSTPPPYSSPIPLQAERYNLDHIQVPPPIPPQAAIIGFGQKVEDPQSELILKGTDYGIAVAEAYGKIGEKTMPYITVIVITGKTFIAAEDGANVYLTKHNEVYDQALAYLKDPQMRDQFAHLVEAVRNHQPISEDTPVNMLRAAQAIAASPDTQTSSIVWNALMSQDARQAALNRLIIESRDFVVGKAVEKTFSAQLPDLDTRRQDYLEAADFLEKANVALKRVNDPVARDSLQQGVTLANQIMSKTFVTVGAQALGKEFTTDLVKDTIFDSTDQNPEQ
ncbi:MAG TPA: hypothetical protein VGI03_13535 [Verrucomicrobiae bacterium]|jgi:hypothetical protein